MATTGNFDGLDELTEAARNQKNAILKSRVQQIEIDESTTVAGMVDAMAGMSIQARNIGLCAKVLHNMLSDQDRPTVFLGLAGPLIAAGLRNVICNLIKNRVVDVVVSTGAILYQDIYAARGHGHFQGNPAADDVTLHDLRIDRIYDTYVDEEKFWETDEWCGRIADGMDRKNYSSRQYLAHLGAQLDDSESIVATCAKMGVPMFCPALNDSSIGIGLTSHRIRAKEAGEKFISIDSIQDNMELLQIVCKSKKTAAIYVAGGVPKNYVNDAIVMAYLYGQERGHDYAIQVTTAVQADGGLSGSTLDEAQSWGKIESDAAFAMAWVEPSVSLPLLAGYIYGKKLTGNRTPLHWEWDGETLVQLSIG